jgi:membrane-associated phospholipid phosphatase
MTQIRQEHAMLAASDRRTTLSFGIARWTKTKKDRLRILRRTATVVMVITMVAGTAGASDDGCNDPQQVTSQTQSEVAQSAPESSSAGSHSKTESSPELDRRDRIFYPGDTERAKPLLRKLTLNILYDQKDIFTSPFHMSRRNAWVWVVSGATIGGLIVSDRRIADAFENSHGQVRWGGRISNIGAAYTLIPIVAGSYGYGVWRDNAKAREIGVLGTETLLDGLIVAGILKEVARRNRPDEPHPGNFWGGGTSFPSGHSIQMWSIASLLAHEYKHQKIVVITAYSLAGIVSTARIAAQKHFASDVVAGGIMGWFIGRYVYETHMSHLAHKHSFLVPMIVPQVQPWQRSYSVGLVFGGSGTIEATAR